MPADAATASTTSSAADAAPTTIGAGATADAVPTMVHRPTAPNGGEPEDDSTRVIIDRPVRPARFSGLTVADYVRDGVALVLLMMSFGLPWDVGAPVTGRIHVVLVTLLSVVSLALPYLLRGGVLPSGWGDGHIRTARLWANVPYVVVVALAVVLDYLDVGDGTVTGQGIAVGASVGLAGAVIAAQPRTPERSPDRSDGALWRAVVVGIGVAVVVSSLVSLIVTLLDAGAALTWGEVVVLALHLIFFAVVPSVVVLGIMRGDLSARDVAITVGGVGLLAAVWDAGSYLTVTLPWSVRGLGPMTLLWPALGAAASAAALAPTLKGRPGAARWVTTAVHLLSLTVVVAGIAAAQTVAAMIVVGDAGGTVITVLVLQLILLAAALVGRNSLRRDPAQGRTVAVVVAGIAAIIAIIQASALAGADMSSIERLQSVALITVLVFAGTIIGVLTIPAVVRTELGALVPASSGAAPAGPGSPRRTTAAAEQPRPAGPSPTAARRPYDARTASDPHTPLEVLADIAATEPSLRPYLAANPSTYPALLDWLGKLGDPAVDEVLRRRGRR
jgi:hypothetical protein